MSEENEIDLFVKLGFGELYWANLRFSLRKQRYLLVIIGVLLAFIGSVVVYVSFQEAPDDRWVKFAEGITPWSYLLLVLVLITPITCWLTTRKVLCDPRAKNGAKLHISNDGIRIEGSTGIHELNWTAFLGALEVSTAFWLLVTRTAFILVPKRCFDTNDDLFKFRGIIRANVPNAKLRQTIS
jgi:hypothetical protein